MSVPGGRLQAHMMAAGKPVERSARQAHSQEHAANKHMKPVKARCYEKSSTVNPISYSEVGHYILIHLKESEVTTKSNSNNQAQDYTSLILAQHAMVSPSNTNAGGQEDDRIQKGDRKRVQGNNTNRRSATAYFNSRAQGVVEKRSEERSKKANLRQDKQDHAGAKPGYYPGGMGTHIYTFTDDVAPSYEHS